MLSRRAALKGACASLFLPALARAQGALPPVVVTVEADGAWDPSYFCDPLVDPRFTPWASGHLLQAGELRYAPFRIDTPTPTVYQSIDGRDFFQKHAPRMVVVNGVDHETVSHLVGPRAAFTGLTRPGYPSLGALVAGATAPDAPLAFMSAGGFVSTEGLVSSTRGDNLSAVRSLLRSNATDPTLPSAGRYQDEAVHALVRTKVRERDARAAVQLVAPREVELRARLAAVRTDAVAQRMESLAAAFDQATAATGGTALQQAVRGALVALSSGDCVAAHLFTQDFDSHSDIDSLSGVTGHRPSLQNLCSGLDLLLDGIVASPSLMARGALVLVSSDFGRTAYNAARGKDHWPYTSNLVFALGRAESFVGGGRVVGASSPTGEDGAPLNGLRGRRVKVEGGRVVVADDADPAGFRLRAAHVHHALRDVLGRMGADPGGLFGRYPLNVTPAAPLPIFAPP
jgi:hypothetical protein